MPAFICCILKEEAQVSINEVDELLQTREDELVAMFEEQFPNMIKNNQTIYIEPLARHSPSVINRLQERWKMEFVYDSESGADIHYMKPLYKKMNEKTKKQKDWIEKLIRYYRKIGEINDNSILSVIISKTAQRYNYNVDVATQVCYDIMSNMDIKKTGLSKRIDRIMNKFNFNENQATLLHKLAADNDLYRNDDFIKEVRKDSRLIILEEFLLSIDIK